MDDKRDQKRFIRRCEIEFTLDGTTKRGISSNFSLNGLFISTNYPFPPDKLLDIVIHLPNGLTSKVKGRVRWAFRKYLGKAIGFPIKSMKNGFGIEILERDDNYLEFIR